MAQDQLLTLAEGAENLSRFLILKPIKAPAQHLAVKGNRRRDIGLGSRFQQLLAVSPKRLLQLCRLKCLENVANRGMGGGTLPRQPKPRVQPFAVRLDEALDLAVRSGSAEHRQHRKQQNIFQPIAPSLAAARIRYLR